MDFAQQEIISRLQGEIHNLNKQITELNNELTGSEEILKSTQQILATTEGKRNEYFKLFSDLQYAVRYFFEQTREDDKFEFDIDDVNSFLAENSIEPLKREYRVSFSIEGVIIVEAESEEEAGAIVDELDVSHWSADIEYFNATADSVDSTF